MDLFNNKVNVTFQRTRADRFGWTGMDGQELLQEGMHQNSCHGKPQFVVSEA